MTVNPPPQDKPEPPTPEKSQHPPEAAQAPRRPLKTSVGIDLGTSNSSVAIVRELAADTLRLPNLAFRVTNERGDRLEDYMELPSYVYYPAVNPEASLLATSVVVGPRAKALATVNPERVIRSAKTRLGDPGATRTLDGRAITPARAQAEVLRATHGALERVGLRDLDAVRVVVAVPSSFNTRQREETRAAAEMAGFSEVSLVEEPHACLCYGAHLYAEGKLPISVDFSTPKRVLVYDLGGGTLDVSLHEVWTEPGRPIPRVKNIAIGEYTAVGGDTFDEAVTGELFKRFVKKYDIHLTKRDERDVTLVKARLRAAVESWKVNMSQRAEMLCELNGGVDVLAISDPIDLGYQLDDHARLMHDLSLGEFREIVADLFADDLTFPAGNAKIPLEDAARKDLLGPVLDVLRKARARTGTAARPDLVLACGGMVQCPLVLERLREFFTAPVVVPQEPHMAVSRGAALYNRFEQRGKAFETITGSKISLAIQEGATTEYLDVVQADKPLPYENEWEFELPTAARDVKLPFSHGETHAPLLEQEFSFERELPAGTLLRGHVTMSAEKIATFDLSVVTPGTAPGDAPVTAPAGSVEISVPPARKSLEGAESSPGKDVVSLAGSPGDDSREAAAGSTEQERAPVPAPSPPTARAPVPAPSQQAKVDPLELERVFGSLGRDEKPRWTGRYSREDVTRARNLDKVLKRALTLMKTRAKQERSKSHPTSKLSEHGFTRLVMFLGKLAKIPYARAHFLDTLGEVQDYLVSYVRQGLPREPSLTKKFVQTRVREVVQAIGRLHVRRDGYDPAAVFDDLATRPALKGLRPVIFQSLGRFPPHAGLFTYLTRQLKQVGEPHEVRAVLWALGKQGKRTGKHPLPIRTIQPAVVAVLDLLARTRDLDKIAHACWALLRMTHADAEEAPLPPARLRDKCSHVAREVTRAKWFAGTQPLHAGTAKSQAARMRAAHMLAVLEKKLEGTQLTHEEQATLLALHRQPA